MAMTFGSVSGRLTTGSGLSVICVCGSATGWRDVVVTTTTTTCTCTTCGERAAYS